MNLDNCLLINVAFGNKYIAMQKRLRETCSQFNLNTMMWTTYPSGAKLHSVSPYGFKYYAIREVLNIGTKIVIWADSAVYIVKNPLPFCEIIREKSVVFLGGVDSLKMWVNDKTLVEFNLTRNDIEKEHMISGSLFGFDFSNPIAVNFFNEIEYYEKNGWFCGNGQKPNTVFKQHRHDEAVISLLLIKHKIKQLQAYDYFQGGGSEVMFRASKEGF